MFYLFIYLYFDLFLNSTFLSMLVLKKNISKKLFVVCLLSHWIKIKYMFGQVFNKYIN